MGFTQHDVEELSRALDEPGWLTERRLEAWGYVEKLELPAERDEPWRYTDLRRLKFSLDQFSAAPPEPFDAALTLPRTPALEEQGVVLLPLYNALQTRPELVRQHLFSLYHPGQDIFTGLHAALFAGGTFLYVPRGVDVEVPIEATRTLSAAGTGSFPHTLVVVEEGASVVFVDRFESPDLASPTLSDAGIEVVAGAGSHVTVVSLQEYGRGVWHFLTHRGSIGAQATMRSLVVTLGATFSRAQVENLLAGEHASLQMLGLYFAEANQHFDMRTLQDHAAPACTSDLLYKGALKDTAHTVYSGLIRVHEGAAKTDAYQANRNLVLSDHAKADSKPELEILNNDVRCTHGSTVGQIDEAQLFYLQSRGISKEEAERLIALGFFEDVINRVGVESLQATLREAIARKLG
ncbi:MAG TPA: Fe-S cluster assembly protein SufD [Actinomycetota bacterium]|nr:Fe-S cluster assembly protein SufD [Actinomycetota bacterium]